VLWILTAASLFATVLTISACMLSAQISQREALVEIHAD
jgi:hypothetical protein